MTEFLVVERHQLGIEFNNQLPPAAAVSNKNHHPSVVDLASRSQSSFAETTNVGFSREVVPARAEVSPKNMAQEIVDAAYLAGSMDNLAALVVPLHPRKCIPSYPESYSGIKQYFFFALFLTKPKFIVCQYIGQKHASNKGQEELVKKKVAVAAQIVSDALRALEPMLSNIKRVIEVSNQRPSN